MSTQSHGRSRINAALKGVALVFVATVVALALVESALRTFDMYRPEEYPPPPRRPDLFVSDSTIGYHLWPSTRTCMRYPADTHGMVTLISNSDGLASSRELGEPDPRPRVLVIGDSFTMGLGVSEGKRFSEVVEELEPRWRVDNMGMPGWGLDLMTRALESLGHKAMPDVVVLAVYTEVLARLSPDWLGQGSIPFRKFELIDGKLIDAAPYQAPFWRGFHVAELARTVKSRASGSQARNRYPLNEALLNRFYDLTRALNATPVVLFFPGTHTTQQARERRGFLATWTRNKGVVYADFTDAIHGAGVDKTYIPDITHWNELGHRVAGRALHRLLADKVLQGKGSEIDTRTLPAAPWSRRIDYCSDKSVLPEPSAKADTLP